jgi:L-iditol 2-dehydrogenase
VVAIDINQTRLDFAKANAFASHVFCLPAVDNAKTIDEQLRRAKENIQIALSEFGEPDGFDLVFECTGAEQCIQMSVHVSSLRPPLFSFPFQIKISSLRLPSLAVK